MRRIQRSIYEEARDVARALAKTDAFERSRRDRKRVEMLFAQLKRIFRLDRLRLRGPCGAQFEFTLAAIAQNLRRLAKLVVRPPPVTKACFAQGVQSSAAVVYDHSLIREWMGRLTQEVRASPPRPVVADFCNKIGTKRTSRG